MGLAEEPYWKTIGARGKPKLAPRTPDLPEDHDELLRILDF